MKMKIARNRYIDTMLLLVLGIMPACRGSGSDGVTSAQETAVAEATLVTEAMAIHQRVVTIDSHDDIPLDFATPDVDPGLRGERQVDLPKMEEGGLNAAFFIVFVGQTQRTSQNYAQAKADADAKFDAIHRMTEEMYPDRIELAYSADDVERIAAQGKLVAAIGIENGYVIGQDLSLLGDYHTRGARYITLAHNGHNDIADSAAPRQRLGDTEAEHDGVSAFGEAVIAEMNRLGIMVDVSHISKQAMLDAVRLSVAPVIASHSSTRTLRDHPRNLDDEQLLALRDNGGVMQTVALDDFVSSRDDPPVAVRDFIDHIDYAVSLIGVDHVGISSDFDGGGGVVGWSDASETFNVTLELVRRGYTEDEIAKIWGGNLLRVWREVEAVARDLQAALE